MLQQKEARFQSVHYREVPLYVYYVHVVCTWLSGFLETSFILVAGRF